MSDLEHEAYPLDWPANWPRHKGERGRAAFGTRGRGDYGGKDQLSIANGLSRLTREMNLLAAWNEQCVVSSNVELRLDGLPGSNRRAPDDPGVAVYFRLDGNPYCLACDKWDRVADNLAAVAAHIGAMRGQERWGVGSTEQAFAGYAALPGRLPNPNGGWCWISRVMPRLGRSRQPTAPRRRKRIRMLGALTGTWRR